MDLTVNGNALAIWGDRCSRWGINKGGGDINCGVISVLLDELWDHESEFASGDGKVE